MSPNDILESIRPINPSAFGMTREQAMMMQQRSANASTSSTTSKLPYARWTGHEPVSYAEGARY